MLLTILKRMFVKNTEPVKKEITLKSGLVIVMTNYGYYIKDPTYFHEKIKSLAVQAEKEDRLKNQSRL